MGSTGRVLRVGGGANRPSSSAVGSDDQPQVTQTAQQAATANNTTFSATDDSDFHELQGGRNYYQSQTFGIDTQMAIQDYLHDQPVSGSMYSPSQQLNNAMEKGLNLTANQQYMVDSLMDGMHNLGQNLNLTHFGRVSIIDNLAKNVGAAINQGNYENMSEAQLKQAFVGSQHSVQKFLSTSHNEFRKAPNGGAPFTDKAVKLNIKAPAKTQALMPGTGPGGNLGEIILAPGQNFRITDVRFGQGYGRSGGGTYRNIEFDIEFY